MLPVSLYCTFLIAPSVYYRPVSCVAYVASFSVLYILIAPSVYYRPVSCVAYVASFSVLTIFDCPIGLFSKYTKIVRNEFTENYVEIFFFNNSIITIHFFFYVAVR
jgi:hypothetical protein